MISRTVSRLLALVLLVTLAAFSVGCDGTVGVGLSVGYPYGPYGGYGPWGPGTVYIGGPVIR